MCPGSILKLSMYFAALVIASGCGGNGVPQGEPDASIYRTIVQQAADETERVGIHTNTRAQQQADIAAREQVHGVTSSAPTGIGWRWDPAVNWVVSGQGFTRVLDDTVARASEGDVVQMRDGSLLATWDHFLGDSGDGGATEQWARRSLDGGQTWSAPWALAKQHFFTQFGKSNGPFSTIREACHYRDTQTIFFSVTGTEYSIYDDATKAWTATFALGQFGGGGCPFESVGAASYYRANGHAANPQLILFNAQGDQYTVYDDSAHSWAGPFSLTRFGGGGCPFARVSAVTYYRANGHPENPQLILFNQNGDQYTVYDDNAHSWAGPFALSQFGGGGMPFAQVGAAFSYQESGIVLFNKTGDSYIYYDDVTHRWWDPFSDFRYSPGFLRSSTGQLVLYYVKKYTTPSSIYSDIYYATSIDEGVTWERERRISGADDEYLVMNNSRVVRLSSGRIVVPVARVDDGARYDRGLSVFTAMTYLSDDDGQTWSKSANEIRIPDGAEEPGVVELSDSRLMMFIRHGAIGSTTKSWKAYSNDQGMTWGAAQPSGLNSPSAPSSVKRLTNGDLITIWNNVAQTQLLPRNPLTAAISRDNGLTWANVRDIENDTSKEFAYTSILQIGSDIILSYYDGSPGAQTIQRMRRFPLSWLYP